MDTSVIFLQDFFVWVGNADDSGDHTYDGGIFNFYSRPTVTNCTFSGNSADDGAGMYDGKNSNTDVTNCQFNGNHADSAGGMYNENSDPTLTNCIFWGNTATALNGPQIHNDGSSSPTVTYSDVKGYISGTGNIHKDPLLVDPNGPDGQIGTKDDNLRLSPSSPCIDVGDPNYYDANLSDRPGRLQQVC